MAEIEQHQHYKQKAFLAKQEDQVVDRLRQYDERSKRALAHVEREFLLEKQDLLKNRANSLWDIGGGESSKNLANLVVINSAFFPTKKFQK